jgi:hypothetical protein
MTFGRDQDSLIRECQLGAGNARQNNDEPVTPCGVAWSYADNRHIAAHKNVGLDLAAG